METTIIPVGSLPSCVTACGRLFDANGACVPPGTTTADADTYNRCFCSNAVLQPFSTGVQGVCDNACTGAEAGGITSIQQWYADFCSQVDNGATPMPTAGSGDEEPSTGESGGGGDWISNHWRWVIMLVILVVGIAGIWIGACIWRRRYLRRRDRKVALGKAGTAHASWGASPAPAPAASDPVYVYGVQPSTAPGASSSSATAAASSSESSSTPRAPGQFMPGINAEAGEGGERAARPTHR